MIIQCPNCQTKFSLATESLGAASSPKFHCSRCDHVFAMGDASTDFADSQEQFEQEIDEETDFSELETDSDDQTPSDEITTEKPLSGQQLDLIPEKQTAAALDFSAGRLIDTLLDEDDSPLITAPWPDENNGAPLEADMRKALSQQLEMPQSGRAANSWAAARAIVEAAIEDEDKTDTQAPAFEPLQRGAEEPSDVDAKSVTESEQTKESFIKGILESPLFDRDTPLSAGDVVEDKDSVWPKGSADILTDFDGDFEEFDEQELLAELDATPNIAVASRRIGLATAVPAAVCLLLWLFSSFLVQTPQVADTLLSLTKRELPAPAPRGVSLDELRPNFVALDDGREVVEITGSLINQTSTRFGSIKIEASSYDKKNRPIDRVIVHADNSLSSVSRLASLKHDDINSLQSKRQSEKSLLDSYGRRPFRVVFTDDSGEAAWFSANIYSVTTTDSV